MGEKAESQVIEESDVGSADILDLGATAETPESVPEVEVEPVADEEEGKIDWAPLANDKIMGSLDRLAQSLLRLKNVEAYKNEGTSSYVGFRTKPRRGICFVYLSEKSARVSLGEVEKENGRTRGKFPKHLIFKATESGFERDGEKVKTKEITAKVKAYAKARGWV